MTDDRTTYLQTGVNRLFPRVRAQKLRVAVVSVASMLVAAATATTIANAQTIVQPTVAITVRNVVLGSSPDTNFAYPMIVSCVNQPATDVFIDLAPNGNIGKGLVAVSAGNFVSLSNVVTTTEPVRAFISVGTIREARLNFANGVRVVRYGTSATGPVDFNNPAVATIISSLTTGTITPGETFINYSDTQISPAPIGYNIGDLVVPRIVNGYVIVPVLSIPAGQTTPVVTSAYAIYDAKTPTARAVGVSYQGLTATPVIGTQTDIAALGSITSIAPISFSLNGTDYKAGESYTLPAATWLAGYLDQLRPVVAGGSRAAELRIYDFRTDPSKIPAGMLLGTPENLNQVITRGNPAIPNGTTNKTIAAWINELVAAKQGIIPARRFSLRGGESRTFNATDLPNLSTNSSCVVKVLDSQGSSLTYSSSTRNPDNTIGTPLQGEIVNGEFVSRLTRVGESITVTNAFYGDMYVSKAVTGDPKTNIATYEISVSCDRGGPRDTFLLKDRQTKVYTNLPIGTICTVVENRSDGAFASYKDNSGDPNDARVTIVDRATRSCARLLTPTPAVPGGPSPVLSSDSCVANMIITNDYTKPPAPRPATTVPGATTTTIAGNTDGPGIIIPQSTTTTSTTTTIVSLIRGLPTGNGPLALPLLTPAIEAAPAVPVDATPVFVG